jgi:hypothetical protein
MPFCDTPTTYPHVLPDTEYHEHCYAEPQTHSHAISSNDICTFPQLHDFRCRFSKKLIFGHLNINSIRNKFGEICDILNNNYVDIFGLSESKVDDSFPSAQFDVKDYKLHRQDRTIHGGGLMLYIKSSIPHRRRNDLLSDSMSGIECIVIETKFKNEKIFFILVYKPPSVNINVFTNIMSQILDVCLTECKSYYIMGDINIDFKCLPNDMSSFLSSYNLVNVIKTPTCHKNSDNPSLIDVIITNTPERIACHLNTFVGVSDFHNLICASTKLHAPKILARKIMYRSYKNFDIETYENDLYNTPFQICNIFDDVDDAMWCHNVLLNGVINQHAPLKKKLLKRPQVPYMNSSLRKAVNCKAMLRRKYFKNRCNSTWEKYKNQRNYVTRLKRLSIKNYFDKKCSTTSNSKDFWTTVRPFISDKNKSGAHVIQLLENDKLLSSQSEVCNVLNEYFINIAEELSESSDVQSMSFNDIITHYENHESVQFIKDFVADNNSIFCFNSVNSDIVLNKLNRLKTNKSCGYDCVPAKLLKMGAKPISQFLTPVINQCISQNTFPQSCKFAEVSPLFKKGDALDKVNYRPVSVLTALSKIIEGILCDQVMCQIEKYLCKTLSAYRHNYSCSNVILKCVEDWKESLDVNNVIGCVAMDLSKAFDSIPHSLTAAKLHAYGFSFDACKLILNYLSHRQQRVKINDSRSEWLCIKRGVPQGSLLGPVLFNAYINDLIILLQKSCTVYNYADDNTLSYSHANPDVVKFTLEKSCLLSIQWFSQNYMKVNPDKFQFMLMVRGDVCNFNLNVNNVSIQPVNCIKLLGVCIDSRLDFGLHIKGIIDKCSKQIGAMSRLSHVLISECKLKIVNAFIRANFNYCCVVYNECKRSDAQKLEKLLKRALRYVYLDFTSSYGELLLKSNMSPLYICRQRVVLHTVHKILNDNCPPIDSSVFKRQNHRYGLRNVNKLEKPYFNTYMYGFHSFYYQGALLWNILPDAFKNEDFNVFKDLIRNWSQSCDCGQCLLCLV